MNIYDRLSENESYKESDLKRLWSCLTLRDRIIALRMRRPLQILPSHFYVYLANHLQFMDLADEIYTSKVYNPKAKSTFCALLSCQCRVAVVLTPLIMIIHASDGTSSSEGLESVLAQAENVKLCLQHWHSKHFLISSTHGVESHPSITLFKQLNRLYYEYERLQPLHSHLKPDRSRPKH